MLIAAAVVIALAIVVIAAIGLVYLAPETAAHFAIEAQRRRSGLVRKEIDIPDGPRFVYLDGGAGEVLMLLHGFGADKDNFTRVARFLTQRYRVIAPDQIGFGESAHPQDADYAPPAQAERLRALIQALGIAHLHLGGSSMGGQIALTYAALYPAEVKSLWLLDAAGVWSAPESEARRIIRETGQNPLQARSEDELRRLIGFVMSDPPFIPGFMIKVMVQERIRNFTLEQRIFKQTAGDSVEQRIDGLSIPALIVWGDQDRAVHVATAELLHRLLPHSRVTIMPGVGHLPMLERPRQSAEDYLFFRAGI